MEITTIKTLVEEARDIAVYLTKAVYFNYKKVEYNIKTDRIYIKIDTGLYRTAYYKDTCLYNAQNELYKLIQQYIEVKYNAIRLKPEQVHEIYCILRVQGKL